MDYRPLGRTGVQVSKLCLGTMMFGAWGNTDHDDSIRIIHAALDAGINFVDTADVYSAGESEEIVGKALKGRRDDVVLATKFCVPMGEDPNHRGGSRRWIIARGRELAAAARHRLDRPLPAAPPRPAHRHRRDARRAHRPRPAGQGPLHRLVVVLRRPDRRGAVGRARAAPRALPHRAAALLAARPRRSSSTSCPPRSATAWASSPTARSPAAGCRAAGAPTARRPRPPASGWRRASTCRCPRTSASSRPSSSSREVADDAGAVADRAGHRLRRQPPRRDLGDHRPAHDGAARQPAARRRRRARRGDPRPHRRDRRARRQPQPRRHQLRRAGPPARCSAGADAGGAPRQAAVSRCGSFQPGRGKWQV